MTSTKKTSGGGKTCKSYNFTEKQKFLQQTLRKVFKSMKIQMKFLLMPLNNDGNISEGLGHLIKVSRQQIKEQQPTEFSFS